MKHLAVLKKINLSVGQYAVFGSGPLAVRGIRPANDLDLIVKDELWRELNKKYPSLDNRSIKIGKIEVYRDWLPWLSDKDQLIDSAEIFDGVPFVKLEYVLAWKKKMGRDKDLADIKLIENYFKKQS